MKTQNFLLKQISYEDLPYRFSAISRLQVSPPNSINFTLSDHEGIGVSHLLIHTLTDNSLNLVSGGLGEVWREVEEEIFPLIKANNPRIYYHPYSATKLIYPTQAEILERNQKLRTLCEKYAWLTHSHFYFSREAIIFRNFNPDLHFYFDLTATEPNINYDPELKSLMVEHEMYQSEFEDLETTLINIHKNLLIPQIAFKYTIKDGLT